MKTVLITGAGGFIGRNLTKELLDKDYLVIGIDNFSTGEEKNIGEFLKNKNFVFSKIDIRDKDDLFTLFKTYNPEIIFHLAALPQVQYSIENPIETNEVNVRGTLNLLEVSRRINVKRFVFASSAAIYGDVGVDTIPEYEEKKPMSPYATQKLIGEEYCKLYYRIYGLETICLRLMNIYGPYQNPKGGYANLIPKTIKKCLNSEPPEIYGDGFQTRDFCYVKDVVKAFIISSETKNKECFGDCFNIGTGISSTVHMVIDEIQIQTDTLHIEPITFPPVVEPRYQRADIDKAKKSLGWDPLINLSDGLKRTIEFFELK